MNPFRYKPTVLVGAVVLGVAASWLAMNGRAGAVGPQDRPMRVAVANVPRILSELRESNDIDERMKAEVEKLKVENVRRQEEIKGIQAQAGNFRKDSPQYEDLQNRFIDAVAKHKVWGETEEFKRQAQQKRLRRMMYDKIYAAISEYAGREGIDLVISDLQPTLSENDLAQMPLERYAALLNERRVLYANKAADISQAVIALMDSKYKGEGAVGSAGGAGPGPTPGPQGNAGTGAAGGPIDTRPTDLRPNDARPAAQSEARPAQPAQPDNRAAGAPRRNGNR